MRYVKVLNDEQISVALTLRTQFWDDEPSLVRYYQETLPLGLDDNTLWLVYDGDILVGLIGVYTFDEDEPGYDDGKTIWLDWFMVVEKFRRKGFGKQILLDVIDYCRRLERFKYMRLDTTFWEGRPALCLYDKMMDLREVYSAEKPEKKDGEYYLVYSKALGDWQIEPWDNRFLGLNRPGMS